MGSVEFNTGKNGISIVEYQTTLRRSYRFSVCGKQKYRPFG